MSKLAMLKQILTTTMMLSDRKCGPRPAIAVNFLPVQVSPQGHCRLDIHHDRANIILFDYNIDMYDANSYLVRSKLFQR